MEYRRDPARFQPQKTCSICGNIVILRKTKFSLGCMIWGIFFWWPVALVLLMHHFLLKGKTQCPVCEYDASKNISVRANATAISDSFRVNQEAAAEEYQGKIVVVSGEIKETGKTLLGLLLVINGAENGLDIRCELNAVANESRLRSYSTGDQITIIGTVTRAAPEGILFMATQILPESG